MSLLFAGFSYRPNDRTFLFSDEERERLQTAVVRELEAFLSLVTQRAANSVLDLTSRSTLNSCDLESANDLASLGVVREVGFFVQILNAKIFLVFKLPKFDAYVMCKM